MEKLKKFGFFNTGKQVKGWEKCDIDYKKYIQEIEKEDKEGKNPNKEIISIPTPFARIQLFDLALKKLAEELKEKHKIENKNTIYCRLVSDLLDFAEIIHSYPNFKNFIEIEKIDLTKLFERLNDRKKEIMHALNLYLGQDKDSFYFNIWENNVFIFYYKDKNGFKKLLGTTAPKILYLPAPRSFLPEIEGKEYFKRERDLLFEERSDQFKMYFLTIINKLKKSSLDKAFDNLIKYIEITKEIYQIPDPLKQTEYKKLKLKSEEEVRISTFFNYTYEDITPSQIENWSDFIIDIKYLSNEYKEILKDKFKISVPPLALPKTKDNETLKKKYIHSTITEKIIDKVPYKLTTDLNDRDLPNENIKYPYLVFNDFLEEYILYLTKENINKDSFETFTTEDSSFLLPLKLDYFYFFSLKDLKENLKIENFQTIRLDLSIPIKKGKVAFFRTYYKNKDSFFEAEISEQKNEGGSIPIDIEVFISPPIRYKGKNIYNILIKDSYKNPINIKEINFYKEDPEKKIIRIDKEDSKYVKVEKSLEKEKEKDGIFCFHLEDTFDFIHLIYEFNTKTYSAILIPKFKEASIGGSKKYIFAIDFGTTNTYVSVLNEDRIENFEIKENDLQIASLKGTIKKLKENETLNYFFFPITFGKNEIFKFPTRTAIAYPNKKDFSNITNTIGLKHTNIAFFYEKFPVKEELKVKSKLKWIILKDTLNEKLLENYFEQLFFMLRNKVILNNGDLQSTEILWFYPYSMPSHKKETISSILENLFNKYFEIESTKDKLKNLTESIAPFYYFNKNLGVTAQNKPAAVIDIGGGTSDILIFLNNEPILASSFRFAAEAIFGGGYNFNAKNNGFILYFKDEIEKKFKNYQFDDLIKIQNNLIEQNLAMDTIEFWFSLENYKKFYDKTHFSFLEQLKITDEFKIIFLIFYSALFYYIDILSEIYKTELKDQKIQTYCFSGLGSKTLSVLSPSQSSNSLQIFLQKFLNLPKVEIKGIEYNSELSNPKEFTCKGGLEIIKNNKYNELSSKENDFYKVILGSRDYQGELPSYVDLTKKGQKNENFKKIIINEIQNFIDRLEKTNKEFSFTDKFGIDNFNKENLKIFKEKLEEYFDEGIQARVQLLKEEDKEKEISETLFFYPIIGSLAYLAHKIATNK